MGDEDLSYKYQGKELVKTTTTVPEGKMKYIRANGYKVSELILLGLKAKENNPQMIDRIRKIEEEVNWKLKIYQRELETIRKLIVDLKEIVQEKRL